MIRPWIFEFFPELTDLDRRSNPRLVTNYFEDYLKTWQRDELLGFEGIFFSEHHFGGAYGASPNLLIAAIAMPSDSISFEGKYYSFKNLRLLPRPAQTPSPPKWTTVVSDDSARKAARRHSKISTGFNPTRRVKEIFDSYRDEADQSGIEVGPEHLGLRRRVVIAQTESEAKEKSNAVAERLKRMLSEDPRAVIKHVGTAVTAVPDDTKPVGGGGFVMAEEEFIVGTPRHVADEIVSQCRAVGAGHFLAVLHWGAPHDEVAGAHEMFGREIVPMLRKAEL
jgi:alkanesulfonate monooxygenase SsuD/methylene tetrahydromethanopterin reductase-like flavin-dependent oxidoreductase (luciferase family)